MSTPTITTPAAAPTVGLGRPPKTPTPPGRPRRPRRSFQAWRARFVVVLMLAGAAYGGTQVYQARTASLAEYDLGAVTLTAQPVVVEGLRPGQVTSVSVHAEQVVKAGQELGRMLTTTTNAAGKVVRSTVRLTAPASGVILDEAVPVGTMLQPGLPFVQLYDPATLTFVAHVPVSDLAKLSSGMSVRLRADGLPTPIDAVLQRVVPRVGNAASGVSADDLQVVLTPRRPASVAQLVPGLSFVGTVDTASVPERGRTALYKSA